MKQLMTVAIALLTIAAPRVATAQVDRATLTGTVVDTAGAIVPGATVSITNTATNVSSQQRTTDTGSYLFVNLIPGQYQVMVELQGFKKSSQLIALEVGQRARLDSILAVGEFNETVSVTEAPRLLNSNDATLGAVIPQSQVANLPLAIRNWDDLLALVMVNEARVSWSQSTSDARQLRREPAARPERDRARLGLLGVTYVWRSGRPFTVNQSGNNVGQNMTGLPNVVGDTTGPETVDQWFNINAFQPVTSGTFGNELRNRLTGPGYQSFDMTLQRVIRFKSHVSATLRWDVFNLFNTTNFGLPNRNISDATTVGTISSLAGDARIMQLAVRLTF